MNVTEKFDTAPYLPVTIVQKRERVDLREPFWRAFGHIAMCAIPILLAVNEDEIGRRITRIDDMLLELQRLKNTDHTLITLEADPPVQGVL